MTYSLADLQTTLRLARVRGHHVHCKLQPWTDMWMRGGTTGIILGVGRKYVMVRVYCMGKPVRQSAYKFSPDCIAEVEY